MGTISVMALTVITLTSLPGGWLQAIHVHRRKSVAGLSIGTQLFWVWSSAVWGAYFWTTQDYFLLATSVSSFLAYGATVVGGCRYGSFSWRAVMASTAIFVAGMTIGWSIMGLAIVATVALVLTVVSRFPQFITSWKRPSAYGISYTNFALSVTSNIAFGLYGVVQADWVLISASVYCVGFSLFVIARAATSQPVSTAISTERPSVETQSDSTTDERPALVA